MFQLAPVTISTH